ncbi:MAG: ABC transporter permease [Firmicutes bacterium]|nr:ABC transporter permease [Bacillota bacterium]
MITLVKVEWRKLSRTPFWFASIAASAFGSLAVLTISFNSQDIWFAYIHSNLLLTHALLIPLVMGLMAAYVFGREYVAGTAAGLRLSRFTVRQVVLAKYGCVLGVGLLMSGIAVATALVAGMATGLRGFYWELVLKYGVVSLLSCVFAACSAPLVGAVAVWEKGFFAASVLAAAAPLIGLLGSAGLASRLNPWGLPTLFVGRFLDLVFRDPLLAMEPVWPTAVVSLLAGLMATVAVQSRADIHLER